MVVARSFLRYRRSQVALLFALAVVLGFFPTAFATVGSSALGAARASLAYDLGGRAYALNTSSEPALEALAAMPSASAVNDTVATAGVGDVAVPVSLRTAADPTLDLAVVVEGSAAARPGEALLSRATARALDVGPGVEIAVRPGEGDESARSTTVRITGLTVDPGDVARSSVIVLVAPEDLDAGAGSRWLSDEDFYAEPSLKPFLDRRTALYRSAADLADGAAGIQPHLAAISLWIPLAIGVVTSLVMAAFLGLLARRWSADARGLSAAGMAPRATWRFFVVLTTAVVLLGELVGALTGALVVHAARVPISHTLGQDWLTTAPELTPLAVLVSVTALIAVTLLIAAPHRARLARVVRGASRPAPTWRAAGVVTLVAAAALVAAVVAARGGQNWAGPGAALALVVLGASLPGAVERWGARGLRPATAALVRNLAGGLRTVVAASIVIALACGYWSARTTATAYANERISSPLVPPGSFVVSSVTDAAAEELIRAYHDLGGTQVRTLALPDEQEQTPRVVSAAVAACVADLVPLTLAEVPEECWERDPVGVDSLNLVGIGSPGDSTRADDQLAAGGEVGVLRIVGVEARITDVESLSVEPDALLGGNLPGLVVAPDSELLRRFELAPSGSSMLALLDFGALSVEDRMRVRALVPRLAPSAETADGTGPTVYDRIRAEAAVAGLLGAAVAGLLLVVGASAMSAGSLVARRTLTESAATSRVRRRVYTRWLAVLVLPTLAVIPLTWLTASAAGVLPCADLGPTWFVPGVVLVLASVVACRILVQVPPRTAD